MPISITCPACGKRLKAKDDLAGRSLPCPGCREMVTVPTAEDEAAQYLLGSTEPVSDEPAPSPERNEPEPAKRPARSPVRKPKQDLASLAPLTTNDPPLWLRHLHWLLALALIPLALSLLQAEDDAKDLEEQLKQTLAEASPQVRIRVAQVLQNMEEGKASMEDFFAALPEGKLAGAMLARRSLLHWAFAAVAAVVFLAFLGLLGSDGTARVPHLLGVGAFTATVGILFLVIVQALAEHSQGVWIGGRGIGIVIFFILKLIGFSYRAALDPENGFVLSFVGFTLGVGLCEEVCKALPLLWLYRREPEQSWRGAFLWGLASGVGFGIAEGIMYSADFYNGLRGPGIYAVRFVSCVALHGLWTGSAAITLHQNQGLIQQERESWYEYIFPVLRIVAVPMILHGLYDTLLKKEMSGLALLVAVLSFGFLAFQISRLRGRDDEKARDDMLQEYKRRRATQT